MRASNLVVKPLGDAVAHSGSLCEVYGNPNWVRSLVLRYSTGGLIRDCSRSSMKVLSISSTGRTAERGIRQTVRNLHFLVVLPHAPA
jgi:hypothetical protein